MSCYVGIDIGGTNFRMALINQGGNIVKRLKQSSFIEQGRESFCRRLLTGLSELCSSADCHVSDLAGIGIGVPGLVTREGLITSSVNMRPLDGFNLAEYIRQQTDVMVVCGNDANMIALGEYAFGAGRGMKSLAVITIGTGLGSGLILGGGLWTGAGGYAAEFGHITLVPEGEVCACGNHGCLEQYVSAGAMVRSFVASGQAGWHGINGSRPTAADIALLARQGSCDAVSSIQALGRWLGVGLASLLNTLNPEGVVLTGGVAECMDLFEPDLRKELERRCFRQILERLTIVRGVLGDDAGLLGAVALLME